MALDYTNTQARFLRGAPCPFLTPLLNKDICTTIQWTIVTKPVGTFLVSDVESRHFSFGVVILFKQCGPVNPVNPSFIKVFLK